MDSDKLARKSRLLRKTIESFDAAIVAYSGGVDSALVAEVTHEVLGANNSLVVTAVSDSLAEYELESARQLARERGWNFRTIATSEMEDERYLRNDGARCFFCKTELYDHLNRLASSEGFNAILNGANRDDLGDYRPGMKAASRFNIRSPLLEADIGKEEVRSLALKAGLPNWDKPAQPCLSSRIPYGTHVTAEALSMISKAEKHLRNLGFIECRVRHYGETARIELPLDMVPIYAETAMRNRADSGIIAAGYQRVELDPRGLRSGSLNEALKSRR
jgi:uncharacterized protein